MAPNDEGRRAPLTDAGDLRNDDRKSTSEDGTAWSADAHAARAWRTMALALGLVTIGDAIGEIVEDLAGGS